MELVRALVVVYGEVQGVFFRDCARQEAKSLGVTGWVRNQRDGSVKALLEGEKESVEKVIAFLRSGPELAVVTDVEVRFDEYRGEFSGFTIAPTA